MLTELGPRHTESTVLQYFTKHEPYEARIVLGKVYEGCTGWEQKFPSRPTFGCLAECMKGAWVHTNRLTQIHEEETTTPSVYVCKSSYVVNCDQGGEENEKT